MRDFLSIMLRQDGHEVASSRDGLEALQRVKDGGLDLVITDLKLPVADGLEVLKVSRKFMPTVQVIMITVDPARDTQRVMSQYVTSFNPRFIGLVPSEEALHQVAGEFKVFINRNKPNANGFYTVDHTAASFVFDRSGRIRLFVPHEFTSDDWAVDLRVLLRERS